MSAVSKIYSLLVAPLIDIILPPVCLLCDMPLTNEEKDICGGCMKDLKGADPLLAENLRTEINMAQIQAVYIGYEYGDKIRELIHFFKYERFTALASFFAEALTAQIGENENIDLILPVPLHPKKKHERGYNQSELIVRELAKLCEVNYRFDILQRKKYTKSQTKLNKNERMRNVSDAFVCKDDVRDKILLIVDDVITTGSTLKACALAALAKGANSVYLAAVTSPPFSQKTV